MPSEPFFCSIYVCKWATKQTLVASKCTVTQDPIKMKYTSQQLNYFRACYIAFNLIPEGLRTIFKQQWDFLYKATPFGKWKDISQNGCDFYNRESPINRRKNSRLLAMIQRGNMAEWDTVCLFFAILYSDTIGSTLSPVVRKGVDDLRQFRNDIAHTCDAELTDADFQCYVARVMNAFTSLGLPVNKIEDIKNQTDFPTVDSNALKVQADNLNADVQTKEQEAAYNLTSELQSKKKEVETLTHEINSKVESFCILPFKPSHPIIRRVNDVTRIMKKLDELQNDSKGVISTVYLSGIPGCGKSQIARQVGQEIFDKRWREGEDLTFVASLNAETLDSLAESYCSLARHFGITDNALANLEASRNLPEKIEYLKTLIFSKTKHFSNWLIIADNVVDLSSVRGDLPPSGGKELGHGQVLITTQDISSIPVNAPLTYHESLSKGMYPDEAVNLLRHVSEIQNQEEAEKVAEVLEYHPLALVAAAFYVQTVVVNFSPNYSWANYLRMETPRRLGFPCHISLAVEELIRTDRFFKHLFTLLSLHAPEPLNEGEAINHIMNMEECVDEVDEKQIRTRFRKCSLLLYEQLSGGNVIRVHPIVLDSIKNVIGAYPESQKPLVPSEIKARGRKAMLAYESALKTGKVKVYRARIMFIGQDRAGKTSLKNSFLGLSFDPKQQSTDGIELDLSKFEVDVDQVSNWKRTDEKQGVSKFVPNLVRMVAGKLEQEEIEVDPAQEKTVSQVSVSKERLTK